MAKLSPGRNHMPQARTDRLLLILSVSALGHLGALVWVGARTPVLNPASPGPEALVVTVVPVFIERRRAEPTVPGPRPLRPRAARLPADAAPIAPLVAPETDAPGSAPPSATALAEENFRRALRSGVSRCADLRALEPQEKAACLARLGDGAAQAEFVPPSLAPDKQRAFDRAAAANERRRRQKEAAPPPGVAPGVEKDIGMREIPW